MKDKLLHPATIISLLALFIALGGTSYAVSQLPKNSVGNKQLKKNAVTAVKVKDGSLLAKDFKAGQLPQGPRGEQGPAGARGPSDGYVGNRNAGAPLLALSSSLQAVALSPQLPAGNYMVSARANLVALGAVSDIVCSLGDDAVQSLDAAAGDVIPLSMSSGVKLDAPGAVTLQCLRSSGSVGVAQASVSAIRVESLTIATTN